MSLCGDDMESNCSDDCNQGRKHDFCGSSRKKSCNTCGDDTESSCSDDCNQDRKHDFCGSSKKKSCNKNNNCKMDAKTKELIHKIQSCYAKCKSNKKC